MKISLEQNREANKTTFPYLARVEIESITADIDTQFRVPLFKRVNGKTVYVAEVCGFQVEGDSPETAVELIENLLPGLVNFARLPTYVFIARRSHKMYPVYTRGDEVFATTPGGPLFKHVELAKVREYLSDYMHTTGALGVPGKSEKLHVRGVNRETLALIRPIFYLKKRPQTGDDHEFWAPVFPADDGKSIYTYAASGKREVEIDNGREIFRLRRQVAQALIADKRLKEEDDLRADRLLPEYWEKVKSHLEPLPTQLVFKNQMFNMYQEGNLVVAVEYRREEDRYSFYIGTNVEDLRLRTGKDLVRRGLISDPQEVTVQ